MCPWGDKEDAQMHKRKARSDKHKRVWKDIASSVLEQGDNEGSAHRQANAVIARRSKKK